MNIYVLLKQIPVISDIKIKNQSILPISIPRSACSEIILIKLGWIDARFKYIPLNSTTKNITKHIEIM